MAKVSFRIAVGVASLAMVVTSTGCNMMSARWMNNSGQAFYRHGDYSAARANFQRAVADDPRNPDYVYNLASSLKKQGDVARAEQAYRRAIEMDPAHQPSYHGLALVLNDQGRQSEALDLLTTWAETQPYVEQSHVELAWYKRHLGDLPGAESSLRRALQVNPRSAMAHAHLGQVYQDMGQYGQAVASYQRSLAHNWYQPKVKSRATALIERNYASSTRGPQRFGYSGPSMAQHPLPTYQNALAPPQSAPIQLGQPIIESPVVPQAAGPGPSPFF